MSKTVDNLMAAFAGESQANRKYTAYAQQADKEGLGQVAKLFRAAAHAETIHALAHFRHAGKVGKTAENLQDAIGRPVVEEDGTELGILADILDYPAGRIYVVKGKTEHLIPEQGGFIRSFDPETGKLTVRLIEGM